ncbi:hypothetical protein ACIG3E_11315 [Streptomyces sp. NPDC053474]|uniref:hypothetical protein n=1 Tax=Streptomyces sp. NPDC053474 TaxID=3365704 RepID=UPI0037D61673
MIHRKTVAVGLTLLTAFALTACGGTDDKPKAEEKAKKPSASSTPSKSVPPYKITSQKLVSGVPHIDVEVKTTDNLRAVFEKVANGSKEAGQHQIRIACSTGGTKASGDKVAMLNLLAYGSYTPGLWDGDIKLKKGSGTFTKQDGASCPAK